MREGKFVNERALRWWGLILAVWTAITLIATVAGWAHWLTFASAALLLAGWLIQQWNRKREHSRTSNPVATDREPGG